MRVGFVKYIKELLNEISDFREHADKSVYIYKHIHNCIGYISIVKDTL